MYREAKDSYITKYDRPFTAWLEDHVGSAWDEETSDGVGSWMGRVGRRVVVEDSQGFVTCVRYDTIEGAQNAIRMYARLWADR